MKLHQYFDMTGMCRLRQRLVQFHMSKHIYGSAYKFERPFLVFNNRAHVYTFTFRDNPRETTAMPDNVGAKKLPELIHRMYRAVTRK